MVMEFVRGETFDRPVGSVRTAAASTAPRTCARRCSTRSATRIAPAIVHRDLKPANLMVTDSGLVKVMDFGIARVAGTEHLTTDGYMMGTPAYMAPEQVLGREVDGRADLYSIGVVLYRLLTAQLPFNADTAIAMAQKQISEAPTPIASSAPICHRGVDIIDRALAKSPAIASRAPRNSARRFVAAVTPQALGEMPTIATPTPPGLARSIPKSPRRIARLR